MIPMPGSTPGHCVFAPGREPRRQTQQFVKQSSCTRPPESEKRGTPEILQSRADIVCHNYSDRFPLCVNLLRPGNLRDIKGKRGSCTAAKTQGRGGFFLPPTT